LFGDRSDIKNLVTRTKFVIRLESTNWKIGVRVPIGAWTSLFQTDFGTNRIDTGCNVAAAWSPWS
jgi:hypothetical protein